jgi:acyl-homoserine lactone acylase PvdQ
MPNDDAASKWLAEATRANARFTLNLQRAFDDLLPKLKDAYGQPARDAAEMRSQHVSALLAIAQFLDQMEPDSELAHFADQFAKIAQMLRDVHNGIRVPMLEQAITSRSDQTMAWIARASVALAIDYLRQCGHSRKSAAKWAVEKYPDLQRLITEETSPCDVGGEEKHRSTDIETAIISWSRNFSSGKKIKNPAATRVYSVGLDKLKAKTPNLNREQLEDEAHRRIQNALRLYNSADAPRR